MQQIQTLGHDEARKAIDAIAAELQRRAQAAVVVVADSHGELIALLRVDGAPLPSILIAQNKAWTAARERKPSAEIGRKSRDPERGFDIAYYGDPRFVGWGGGLPVTVGGQVVGAVAVSGLSSQEDIDLAEIGIAAMGLAG